MMTSSPYKTTKGSSCVKGRAFRMAWPSPFVSFWRRKKMSARPAMERTSSSIFSLPGFARPASSSGARSKWSSMMPLPRPVMMRISSMPAATASSTMYWMAGLSTMGSISLGMAFVAGSTRVPRPAAGTTALRIFCMGNILLWYFLFYSPTGRGKHEPRLPPPQNERRIHSSIFDTPGCRCHPGSAGKGGK